MSSRTRWLVAVAALLAIGLVSPVAHASAAPRLSLSPTQGPPSTQVTVVGFGFCSSPCSAVDVYFGGAIVSPDVSVASGGGFRATFMVPATALGGVNTVYASQRDTSGTDSAASTMFRVTPSTPVGGSVARMPHGTPTTHTTQPSTPPSSPSSHMRSATPTTLVPLSSTPLLPSGSSTPAAASHNNGGLSPWWWLVIAVGVAGIAGGAVAWRRRAP